MTTVTMVTRRFSYTLSPITVAHTQHNAGEAERIEPRVTAPLPCPRRNQVHYRTNEAVTRLTSCGTVSQDNLVQAQKSGQQA